MVTMVEANEVLGSFDMNLRNYAAGRLKKCGMRIKKSIVREVKEQEVILIQWPCRVVGRRRAIAACRF